LAEDEAEERGESGERAWRGQGQGQGQSRKRRGKIVRQNKINKRLDGRTSGIGKGMGMELPLCFLCFFPFLFSSDVLKRKTTFCYWCCRLQIADCILEIACCMLLVVAAATDIRGTYW